MINATKTEVFQQPFFTNLFQARHTKRDLNLFAICHHLNVQVLQLSGSRGTVPSQQISQGLNYEVCKQQRLGETVPMHRLNEPSLFAYTFQPPFRMMMLLSKLRLHAAIFTGSFYKVASLLSFLQNLITLSKTC